MDAGGKAALTWVGHSTVLLELGGVCLLTDPLLRPRLGPLVRHSAPVDRDVTRAIDAVLVSHAHYDHLDLPSLRLLDPGVRVIAPHGAGKHLRGHGGSITELEPGEATAVGDVEVTAVPAEHDGRRHPRAAPAGTIGFHIAGERGIYFAGDTDIFDAMDELAGRVDVALLPVWGWGPTIGAGHMGPREAADSLLAIKPRIAVPIHWGTFYPVGLRRVRGEPLHQPPREFARLARERAPDVEVVLLEPGERLVL